MPGEGRLARRRHRRDAVAFRQVAGAPAPGPTGRGTPGTAPGASGGRGAADACEVKGLLPMRGGPRSRAGLRDRVAGQLPDAPARVTRTPTVGSAAVRSRLGGRCHGRAEHLGRTGSPGPLPELRVPLALPLTVRPRLAPPRQREACRPYAQ